MIRLQQRCLNHGLSIIHCIACGLGWLGALPAGRWAPRADGVGSARMRGFDELRVWDLG